MIDVVNESTSVGHFEVLDRAGLLVPKAANYRDMYLKFSAYIIQGFTRTKAVRAVADISREDERTVWRAVKVMESLAD